MKKIVLVSLSCVFLFICGTSRGFSEPADTTQPTPTEKRLKESLNSLRSEVNVMRDRELIVQENLAESRAQVDRALDINSNVVGWIKVWTWFVGALLGVSGYLFFKDKRLSELIRKAEENVKSITQMHDEARQKMDEFRLSFPTLKIDKDWVAKDHPSNEKLREVLMQFIVFETVGGKLSAEDHFSRAKAYYYLDEYQSALESLEKVLRLKPEDATAWYNKGVVLGQLGRSEEELAAYDQALKFKPDAAEAWHNKGFVLGQLNRPVDELAAYDQALKFNPEDAETWFNKGVVLRDMNRAEDTVLEAFEHALKFKPDYAQAWYNKGVILGKLNRPKDELVAYEKALTFKPDYAEAWHNKGILLNELNRFDEALIAYEQALRFKSDYSKAWNSKGVVLGKVDRLGDALVAFEQALKFNPDFGEAWYNKGVTFKKLNRLENALAAYKRAVIFKPNFAEAWYNQACVHSVQKDKVNALPALKKSIDLDTKYREMARTDKDFEWLWNDPDFIAIVGKDKEGNDGEDSSELVPA